MIIIGQRIARLALVSSALGAVMITGSACSDRFTSEGFAEHFWGPDWRNEGLGISDWSEYRPEREPQVEHSQFTHDVSFPARETRLSLGERERLEAFLQFANVQPGDTVRLLSSVPEKDPSKLSPRRSTSVVAFLRTHHVKALPSVPQGELEAPDDGVRLVVERYSVSAPADCPDFSEQPNRTYQNLPSRNWSCSTATVLGAMVANPQDLVRGRTPGPIDGERAVHGMERYRTDKTKNITIINAGPYEMTREASDE